MTQLKYWDGTNWVPATYGAQGPTGPTGATGPTGPTGPANGTATPSALGTAAAGTSTLSSHEDHVHPTTGLAPLASPSFTGITSINSVDWGYTSTVTSITAVTLTSASTYFQVFTGSTAQTVTLPVTSTLSTGHTYKINNNSTANITVNSSGGNLVATVIPNTTITVTCVGIALTTAADWDSEFDGYHSNTGTGSVVLATAPTISQPSIDNAKLGYTTTVSSATPIVLTAASNYQQYITGSTAQTITLPVASTMTLGQSFKLVNNNTVGSLTVNSSGANLVITVPIGFNAEITCILASGTSAASWSASFCDFDTTTGTGSVVLSASPTFTGTVVTPISSITSYQKFAAPVAITTATYTVLDTDTFITLSRSAGITVTLPAAASYTGRMLYLKNLSTGTMVSATANVVPIAGGAAATTLFTAATAGKYSILVSNGTNWEIYAQN